jgi:glycerol kinase
MIREKTGLLIDPYFSATKIKWILDNVDKARDKANAGNLLCGTIDAFLIWHLTGGKSHATDATNASRTQLYNIVEDKWDDELLELFDIPASMLPEVKDNVADFGTTTHALFGGHDLKITGVAGDQQAAFIGQACFSPGMVKSTYGTGCFALMNIGTTFKSSEHRMLTTIGYRLNGRITYAFEGSIFIAGAAVQWLRDGIGIIDHAAESENMAQDLEHNDDVYLVPAFTGLGAPHWDPEARGIITGITRNTTRSHLVRAALEAQAYQTEDLLEAMAKDAGQPIAELRVDGGMVANNWVCQFLADITGVRVKRPHIIETTALGAGYLAGLGVGLFDSIDDITNAWSEEARFEPKMDEEYRQNLYQGWKTAFQRCR